MFVKSVESGADGSSVAVLATVPDSSLTEDLRRIQRTASRNEWRSKAEYDDQLGEDEHERDLAGQDPT
jgi:hypothetical protein